MSVAGVRDPRSFGYPVRYDRYAVLTGAEVRAWLMFHLPARGHRAIDAGCGTGVHTGLLADRHNEVLAVDLSAPMLDHARQHRPRGNVRYEHRDLHAVTVANDGWFDTVVCTFVARHTPGILTTLMHLRLLVRPRGLVLVVDAVDERRRLSRAALRADAWRSFRDDVAHGRRPLKQAVELLRLRLDSDWLDHRAADVLLPPDVWRFGAASVFPGARFTDLDGACALSWRAPEHWSGR